LMRQALCVNHNLKKVICKQFIQGIFFKKLEVPLINNDFYIELCIMKKNLIWNVNAIDGCVA